MNDEQLLDAFADLLGEVVPEGDEVDALLIEAGLDPAEIEQEVNLLVGRNWTEPRRDMIVRRAKWYIKQLFPLQYFSQYREGDKPRLTIWRMWFGRCLNVRSWVLAD